jgi:hypothetical protein
MTTEDMFTAERTWRVDELTTATGLSVRALHPYDRPAATVRANAADEARQRWREGMSAEELAELEEQRRVILPQQ